MRKGVREIITILSISYEVVVFLNNQKKLKCFLPKSIKYNLINNTQVQT